MDQTDALYVRSSPSEALSAIASATMSSSANAATVESEKHKRKRNRPILSCLPCHDRKQQCDRTKPCKRCVSRRAPDECTYYEPPVRKVSRPSRVDSDEESPGPSQLERTIQGTLRSMEPATLMGLQALLQLVQTSNFAPGADADMPGPQQGHSSLGSDYSVQVAAAALGQLSQQHIPGDQIPVGSSIGPMARMLRHFRTEIALPASLSEESALSDLRGHFPSHAVTSHLLFHFFTESSIPWLWPILHRPMFDNCYLAFSNGTQPPSMDFVSLLATVCLLSLQFLPRTAADASIFADYNSGRDVLKKRLHDFSRSVLLHSSASAPSLERVQALALLSVYYMNDGNLEDYGHSAAMAIRMAQALCMNRDGSTMQKPDDLDAEIKRRLWWSLFVLDRLQCMALLRPYLIHEQHCDVKLPYNLDPVELHRLPHAHYKPLSEPTEHTFHILQIGWAKILGKVWDECFAIQAPSYRTVLGLEEDIRLFESRLPHPLTYHSQSTQATIGKPYLSIQTRVLTLQICHAHVILLRPHILRRPSHSNDLTLSSIDVLHERVKRICTSFCKRLLNWQFIAFEKDGPSAIYFAESILRLFDAAVTLAVAIIIDPDHSDNEGHRTTIGAIQGLLNDMTYNALAVNAVRCIDVIRRHIYRVLYGDHDLTNPIPSVESDLDHYRNSSTLLNLEPPGDIDIVVDPLWADECVSTFAVRFPGIEALCREANPGSIMDFLNTCHPRQV